MIWPFGLVTFICRFFNLFYKWFYVIPGLFTIIAFQFYFISQVNIKVLKEVLLTFRAIVTLISLLFIIICDISRCYFSFRYDTETWLISFMDLVIYVSIVACFTTIDAWQNMSRFTRFFGPAIMIVISIQNLYYLEIEWEGYPDTVLFTHRGIPISIKTVESTCFMQIALFCISLLFNVLINWDRIYFWNLQEKIERTPGIREVSRRLTLAQQHASQMGLFSPLLTSKPSDSENQNVNDTTTVTHTLSEQDKRFVRIWRHNQVLCGTVILIGLAQLIFFLFDINIIPIVSALTAVEFVAITWVVRKNLHFNVGFIEIGKQFRVWILSLSMLAILFLAALDIYYDYKYDDDQSVDDSDICGFIETLLYCNAIFLGIVRDGMHYPLWFHWILPFIILIPTYWSIYESLFVWSKGPYAKPYWYLYTVRTAFIQVALLMQLILVSVWRDPKHKYFTLIFKKKSREESFGHISQIIEIKQPIRGKGTTELNMYPSTPSTPLEPVNGDRDRDNRYKAPQIVGFDMEEIKVLSDREESPPSRNPNISDEISYE